MVGSLSAGLLLADEAGAHLPSVDDFLPPEILFQGTPFAINRIILIRIVAAIVLLVVLGVTAKRAKLIPGRWQGVVEYGLDFVRDKVVYDVMGEARGKRYVPMITTLFFTIFIFNLCGIIPGMNMAANATVVMPLVFAVWTLIQYWIAAIRSQGLGHYLRHELFTPGVPWPVYFLLAPINLLELLIIRPASLTIRLFANMVSGHLMVATCLAFAQFWMVDAVNKLTEAETKKIKAQGEADANAVLNESLTDNVLKQHYIDALSNADQLVVVPDGADTLVQTK